MRCNRNLGRYEVGRDDGGINQFELPSSVKECKYATLCRLCEIVTMSTPATIYCQTRRKVDWFQDEMQKPLIDYS